MTNKEKFIEVMNQTFNARLTKDDIDSDIMCPPTWGYGEPCLNEQESDEEINCDVCRRWWDKEYKEREENA